MPIKTTITKKIMLNNIDIVTIVSVGKKLSQKYQEFISQDIKPVKNEKGRIRAKRLKFQRDQVQA